MRVLIFILLAAVAYGETLVIDNPGSAGLDNFTSDNIVDIRSARQLINCDIENGDIVKRIGYYVADGNSDTLCDGITSFYDFENNARLIKATYNTDTGIFKYTNPNSLTFAADSIANMYGYKNPPFGYDWVQYENAILGANGINHPFLYMKDQWGTLSIPTPGAPMVAPLNISGGQSGTYSYRLHYFAAGDTTEKSFPGPETQLVFSDGNATLLHFFPERIVNATTWDTCIVLITRNKDNDAKYYVVDTITYKRADDIYYLDIKSDAQLGDSIFIGDSAANNCCADTIAVPGAPTIIVNNNAYDSSTLGAGSHFDSQYVAVAYLDTNFGMVSSIGPWVQRVPVSDGDSAATFWYWGSIDTTFGSNFIDGLVIYMSESNDSTRFKIFDTSWGEVRDTIHEWTEVGVGDWWTKFASELDSTAWFARLYQPLPLTNKIPYNYMDFSFSRLWGAGDDDFPSRLYFSGRSDTGIIGGSGLSEWDFAFSYLGLAENDGDRITGVKAVEEGLLAFKGYSSWFITGFDPDWDMRVQQLSQTIGAVSNNAIANYDREIYFLSPLKRVYKLSGFTDISFKIKSSLQDLSLDTLGQANMIVHEGELWMRLNDTVFICDLKTGRFEWRKYELKGEKYFTYYDSTSSVDYPRAQQLVFSKTGTDSLFGYPRTDGNMEDAQIHSGTPDDPYALLYTSAPFLIGANTKVIQGTIDAEFGDSIFIRLLSLNDDTLASVTLYDGDQISGDNFEFALNGGFSNGYHIVVTESGKTDTNLSSFRIKRITLDYIRYKVR